MPRHRRQRTKTTVSLIYWGYNMAIRAQFDTSPYGNMNAGRRNTIGEVVQSIHGVQGIVNNSRQMRQAEQQNDDDRYLNDVYARNFTGWDGKDNNEFMRRNNQAVAEVARNRSNLYQKAIGISSSLEGAMQQRSAYDATMQESQLKRKQDQFNYEKDVFDHLNNQINYVGEQFALVSEGKQSFGDAADKIKRRGIKARIPTEEQFNANPGQYYDYLIAQKIKNDEMNIALTQKEKELGIKKTEKDLEWYDRLNNSLINQRNRAGTSDGVGGTFGLSNIEYAAAADLAVRKYGKRQGFKMIPIIAAGMKEGYTLDNIDDYIRKSTQSSEFNGSSAREGMQQIWSNRLGSADAKAAMDAVDDLIEKGDMASVGKYLKSSAIKNAGTDYGKEIMGIERTNEFINEIKDDLKLLQNAGIRTNIFSGSMENFRKNLGYVKDKELRKIAERVQLATMRYRNYVSGKSFSIMESKEYKDIMPSISSTFDLNLAKLEALQNTFTGDLENFYRVSMGDNAYDEFILGKRTPPAPTAGESQRKARYQGNDDALLNELFPE